MYNRRPHEVHRENKILDPTSSSKTDLTRQEYSLPFLVLKTGLVYHREFQRRSSIVLQ